MINFYYLKKKPPSLSLIPNIKRWCCATCFGIFTLPRYFGLVNLYYFVGFFFWYLIKMKHIFQDKIKIINISWLPTKKKRTIEKVKNGKFHQQSEISKSIKKSNTKICLLSWVICWVELSIERESTFIFWALGNVKLLLIFFNNAIIIHK